MMDVLEVARSLAEVGEEALPHGLHEVHRVELGAQLPGKVAAHHDSHFLLEPGQELADRRLVTRPGSRNQIGNVWFLAHPRLPAALADSVSSLTASETRVFARSTRAVARTMPNLPSLGPCEH